MHGPNFETGGGIMTFFCSCRPSLFPKICKMLRRRKELRCYTQEVIVKNLVVLVKVMLASVKSSKEVLVISVLCFLVFVIVRKLIHSILKPI